MGRGGHHPVGKVWGLISLHDQHPGAFEATLIRAGVRWRDVGQDGFTWGDCLAIVENMTWTDPLYRVMNPEDWAWADPMRDVVVTIVDLLAEINAKTPRPQGLPRSRMPKRVDRPKPARKAAAPAAAGHEWDDMTEWLKGRVGRA